MERMITEINFLGRKRTSQEDNNKKAIITHRTNAIFYDWIIKLDVIFSTNITKVHENNMIIGSNFKEEDKIICQAEGCNNLKINTNRVLQFCKDHQFINDDLYPWYKKNTQLRNEQVKTILPQKFKEWMLNILEEYSISLDRCKANRASDFPIGEYFNCCNNRNPREIASILYQDVYKDLDYNKCEGFKRDIHSLYVKGSMDSGHAYWSSSSAVDYLLNNLEKNNKKLFNEIEKMKMHYNASRNFLRDPFSEEALSDHSESEYDDSDFDPYDSDLPSDCIIIIIILDWDADKKGFYHEFEVLRQDEEVKELNNRELDDWGSPSAMSYAKTTERKADNLDNWDK